VMIIYPCRTKLEIAVDDVERVDVCVRPMTMLERRRS